MRSSKQQIVTTTTGLIFFLLFVYFEADVSGGQPLFDQPMINKGFRIGETLEYNVKVRGIPAGTKILYVKDKKTVKGREVYEIESKASANKVFSLIYPYDEESQTYILEDKNYPLFYSKKLRDGNYFGNTRIDFDDIKKIAKVVKDEKTRQVRIPVGIQDELSMIYLVRNRKINVGQEYEFPALIGTRIFNIAVQVLRTEEVKTVLGDVNTIVVRSFPNNITLWLTEDDHRVPVRLETNTRFGKLVAELKSISIN